MASREGVRAWLTSYAGVENDEQEHVRAAFLALLDAHDDALSRTCRLGHLTASAFVVDPSCHRFAVVWHPIAHRWLQPGGHIESVDVDVAAAVAREALEETGLHTTVDRTPLRLDIHDVRCRLPKAGIGPSMHFDVGMLAVTEPGATTSAGLDPVAWLPLDRPVGSDATLEALRHAATRRISRK